MSKTMNARCSGETRRYVVDGDLTIYSAAQTWAGLVAQLGEPGVLVEVDLHAASEIDTAGVQVLMMAARAASEARGSVRFLNVRPPVLETLGLLGLHSSFDCTSCGSDTAPGNAPGEGA